MITTFVPGLTKPVFAAYLGNLCVVNPENNPNVSRYCDTDRGFRRGSVSKRPLSLLRTEPFLCVCLFSFTLPSAGKTAVLQQAQGLGHFFRTMFAFVMKSLGPTCTDTHIYAV